MISSQIFHNNYRKIKKLGKGNSGEVILVERISDGTLIALKKMSLLSSQNQKDSLLNEVKVLQKLNHPNIIKYYEYFQEKNNFCIAMEFADDGDLMKMIENAFPGKKYFEEKTILDIFCQIAFAVSYLHEHNIIHRDLKSENIFKTKFGIIKLGDFGVSKQLEKSNDFTKTSLGTPYYFSPEICLGKQYNYKSDIWTVGCILFELCTLEKPFKANCLHDLILTIIDKNPIVQIPDIYSSEIKNLICELLEKNPENRPDLKTVLKKPFFASTIRDLKKKFEIFESFYKLQPEKRNLFKESVSFEDYLLTTKPKLEDLNCSKRESRKWTYDVTNIPEISRENSKNKDYTKIINNDNNNSIVTNNNNENNYKNTSKKLENNFEINKTNAEIKKDIPSQIKTNHTDFLSPRSLEVNLSINTNFTEKETNIEENTHENRLKRIKSIRNIKSASQGNEEKPLIKNFDTYKKEKDENKITLNNNKKSMLINIPSNPLTTKNSVVKNNEVNFFHSSKNESFYISPTLKNRYFLSPKKDYFSQKKIKIYTSDNTQKEHFRKFLDKRLGNNKVDELIKFFKENKEKINDKNDLTVNKLIGQNNIDCLIFFQKIINE